MPVVLVTQDGKQQIKFDRPILLIGRDPECDIVISSSNKVSRKHCCLAMIDNYFIIRDLGSTNGVRINGKSVNRESHIRVGEVLQVGDVGFLLEMTNRAGQKVSPQSDVKPIDPPVETTPPQSKSISGGIDISNSYPVPLPDSGIDKHDTPLPSHLEKTSRPESTFGIKEDKKKKNSSDSHFEIVET